MYENKLPPCLHGSLHESHFEKHLPENKIKIYTNYNLYLKV